LIRVSQAAARRVAKWRSAGSGRKASIPAATQQDGAAGRPSIEANVRRCVTKRTRLSLYLAAGLALLAHPVGAQQASPDSVDSAFRHLYNFEFSEAHRVLDRLDRDHPEDPMAAATRSAVYLFTELDRLDLLASEFFQDRGDRLKAKRLDPDPKLRSKLFGSTQKTREYARQALAKHPDQPDALFALSTAAGIESDYLFFVEKKRLASLKLHKESHSYCRKLLEVDPDYPDAYLTSGFYEYLVGDLPFFLKWFIRFDGVEGDKEKGIERLRYVSENARYSAGFAKVLLAAVYLREERPADSVKMLSELSRDYPKNPLFPREVRRICKEHDLPVPPTIAAGDSENRKSTAHSSGP
jgi:tetratricopeptide (TPR) repeat protein